MIRVKFFSDFCSHENCAPVFKRVLELFLVPEYGTNLTFVGDAKEIGDEEYTHAVILNTATPMLTCPKENVLGLAFEPPQFLSLSQSFVEYSMKNVGRYYIGSINFSGVTLPPPFVEHPAFMWHIPYPIKMNYSELRSKKTKKISIIFSEKRFAPGHNYRYELVKEILNKKLPIDIWGRGCNLFLQNQQNLQDERVRGEFKSEEPYEGYDFSIAVENFSLPAYVSEKYLNCLMYGTIPIYFGCKEIEKYYPGQTIHLKGILDQDIVLLQDITENIKKYLQKYQASVRGNREQNLRNSSLIPHLINYFKKN